MQPKTDNSYERELLGPHTYDRFNNISRICQSKYLNLITAQNAILITIAFLTAIPYCSDIDDRIIRYVVVSLSIVVLGLIIFQQNKNYMQGWQNARFIAESVLSNAWLFSFQIGLYNDTKKKASEIFIDNIDTITKEVELKNFLSMYSSPLPTIGDWMVYLFDEPDITKKKNYYIKHRLDDQIGWYTKKSKYNLDKSNLWFILSLILLILGIILTLFIPLNQFSILGLVSTITASILTWRQTKRFDELKVTYAVAAKELISLKAKFELENDVPDIQKFVEEAEKSISREHKLWFNWTYIT